MIAALRPPSTEPSPCKICGAAAALFGVVDFNRSCEDFRRRPLPLAGVAVYYRRCGFCGFLFSDGFDDWPPAAFARHIYNDGYAAVDPDYAETRPVANAATVGRLFARDKARLRILDYGGGAGRLAQLLRADGFLAAETYDPFVPAFARLPAAVFDVVTCFETLEHLPDPNAGIAAIAARVAPSGLVLLTTLVQPADFDKQGMSWWYIGPRNGHISLFSRRALAQAWRRHGFKLGSYDDNTHIAFRALPDFARHLLKG